MFVGGLKSAVVCLAGLLVAGWGQALHPALDALAHFRFHLATALAVAALLLLVLRQRRPAMRGLLIAAVSFPMLGAAVLPGGRVRTPDLTLLQFNARFDNRAPEAILSQVAATRPDVITLQEISRATEPILGRLQADYPFRVFCPFAAVGGVAVLSRHPATGEWCLEGQGLAGLRVAVGGREVTVAAVHLHWPWPYRQREQVDRLLPELARLPQPMVIAGDFNAASWSNAVRLIAVGSQTVPIPGLRFTLRMGPPVLGPPAVLPVDHVLVPAGSAAQAHRGGKAGSDHLPLIARIMLPP